MDTFAFFQAVLSERDVAFLSFSKGGRSNSTHRTTSLRALALKALDLDSRGFDVWQGMAAIDPDGELNEHSNLARTANNARWCRSAWQDWDVDPDNSTKARDLAAAGQDALEFYSRTLPVGEVPLIVRSGGGLHTYVVFDRDVPAPAWVDIAGKVKALGLLWGCRLDRTRAADLASLMRPVGTNNHKKSELRPVVAVNPNSYTVVNWDAYAAHINTLFVAEGSPSLGVAPGIADIGMDLSGLPAAAAQGAGFSLAGSEFPEADYDQVLARCGQMKWVNENQEKVPEPLWRAALSVAGRCEDGQHAIHWISRKHPGYNPGETEEKFNRTPAPFRCTEFEMHNPGICSTCEHRGAIKSPITLGEIIKPDAPIKRDVSTVKYTAPAQVDDSEEDVPTYTIPLADIPALDIGGFTYSNGRIISKTKIKVKDAEGKEVTKEFDETILDFPFYPINVYVDTRDGAAPVWSSDWYAKPPGAPAMRVTLTGAELASKDSMQKWFGKTLSYTPPFESHTVKLISAMKHWLNKIRAEATREIPPTLGWFRTGPDDENKETVFVLGNKMLTANGIVSIQTANHLGNAGDFETKGTLEEWLRVYELYSREGFEQHALATLVGFSAPLVEMSPLSSMVFNLYGRTGGGKSTLQHFISTIYGTPNALVKGPQGTAMSQTKFIRDMQNLPVMFDDWHKVQPAELAQRYFDWANGWNSEGLTRSGQVNKDRGGKWKTAIMMSTNSDIHDAIKNYFQGDKRAARMRVLQIQIPAIQWGEDLSSSTNLTLQGNYGHAGLIWLDYIRRHRGMITRRIADMQVWIEKNWGGSTAERFYVQGCALLIVALHYANKLGICPLDKIRTAGAIHALYKSNRAAAVDVTTSPDSVLADFINARLRDMIVTINGSPDSNTDRLLAGDDRHLVIGRFVKNDNEDPGILWILLDPLREWCQQKHISCNQLLRDLHEGGFISSPETTINLGWKLPALNSPRAKGIRVDMKKML